MGNSWLIQDIIALAIDISTIDNKSVEVEFRPITHILRVKTTRIERKNINFTELETTTEVNVENTEALEFLLDELKELKGITKEDSFLD